MADVVYPGETIAADVTWKNNGAVNITPRFRLDLRRAGIATWNEGAWITSPTAGPGQTVVAVPYRPVPGDWSEGTTIDVKIMLEGVGQIWQQDDIFVVHEVVSEIEIISVEPYVAR